MNEIIHFTNNPETKEIAEVKVSKNDNAYGLTRANLVRKYLKTAYAGEEAQCEIESFGKTYKVLKRDKVTVFYDESGNTLFDVVNERLQKEYEWIMREGNFVEADKIGGGLSDAQTEPKSAIGKTIASIERQAFEVVEQAVGDDQKQEIAEAEAVMEDQCQAGEVGSAEKEEDVEKQKPMTAGATDAEAKLMEELKKAKPKEFAKPIIEYLVERCRDSESLATDICQDHKTWKGCYDYIVANARKKLNNVSGPVRDDVVFEWAEDYYHLDDKAEAERKAKEEAERKKRRTETAKKATKDKAGKKAAASADQKVKLVAEKSEKSPKTEKQKRNSNDMEGQMDMFSLMGM